MKVLSYVLYNKNYFEIYFHELLTKPVYQIILLVNWFTMDVKVNCVLDIRKKRKQGFHE